MLQPKEERERKREEREREREGVDGGSNLLESVRLNYMGHSMHHGVMVF